MVSLYMPDVQVEIAFDSGYVTPAASRTWTDVSSYVELADGIDIDVGRQDERSVADANTLSLTLDNSDGRFTARRSASPYYPNVKVGRPIRVTVARNLILNPSFEVNTTDWTADRGTFARLADGGTPAGAYCGSYVSTDASTPTGNSVASGYTPASPGQDWMVSAYVKAQVQGTPYRISLLWYNGAAFLSSSSFTSAGDLSGTEFTRLAVTGTAPANTTRVRVNVAATEALAVGAGFRIDAVLLAPTTDTFAHYGDGTYAGWAWTGTAHNSTSIMPRFTGFIDEWPVEWDGSDAYAKASIRATSRLSRLGLTAKLRSFPEQEIRADGPSLYYTMADPTGSVQASESSGNSGAALTIIGSGAGLITFGSVAGPGTDGLTACEFTISGSERYLYTSLPASTSSSMFGAGCFFSTTQSGISQLILGHPTGNPGTDLGLITMNTTGQIVAGMVPVSVTSASSYNDGSTHHAFITSNSGTLTLYVDGVNVGSVGGASVRALPTLRVGQQLIGSIAHVEVYAGASPTLPSAARIAEHAASGIDGFAGERTDERLLRILGLAGIASTEANAETGSETMTYQETQGASVVDALRECEATEGGVLFDGPDGKVHFHGRSRRYLATPAATLDMAAQHVESDYAPRLDRSTLVNDITVDNPTTGESARQVDTASSDEYGIATGSASSLADSYAALPEKASWQIALYAEPRMRCPSLTVDVLAHQGLTPSAQTLLGITVGDLLAVTNAPSQSDTTTPSYFVEGYTESIGPEWYRITYNLSPTYPTLDVFVLDSATRGVLDTDILAY